MAIITIARQEGSLSKEISEGLAQRFGWQFISRDLINKELAGYYGITEKSISKFDEKKPGLLASFSNQHDKYNNYFKLYFFEKVIDTPQCILLGRGGAFFLRNVPGVLRIRIIGSENVRVARIMDRYHLDEKAARKLVNQRDDERAGYTRFFYNMSWDDPGSYDMVINTDVLGTEVVYKMVEGAIEVFNHENYTEKLVKRLKELYLAQKIVIYLLYEEKIPVHFLEVDVHDKTATIMGTVEVRGLIDQVGQAVAAYEGVEQVENKVVFVNTYPPIA